MISRELSIGKGGEIMKKVKILVTTLMVCILCFGATFAVMGYEYFEDFFSDEKFYHAKVKESPVLITPDASKRYHYINYDGRYEIGAYYVPNKSSTKILYDSVSRGVRKTDDSGFSSTRLYLDEDYEYYITLEAINTSFSVNYLRIRYD